jgi:uncharacterized membrane protein YdjX (TVP38/TMEM64 family)
VSTLPVGASHHELFRMKRAAAVAALAALAFLLWSVWDREAVVSWMQHARPLPFFAVMAILPAFGVPFTPFFILAGASFGDRVGLLGSGLALASNLVLCFWIARSGLRPRLLSLLRRFGYELPDFGGDGKDAVRFALMVKLAPGIPAFVKTYGLGVAGVPFRLYFAASMLITGAYAVLLVVLGESLLEHDLRRTLVAGGALVVALAVAFWALRRGRDRTDGRIRRRLDA